MRGCVCVCVCVSVSVSVSVSVGGWVGGWGGLTGLHVDSFWFLYLSRRRVLKGGLAGALYR